MATLKALLKSRLRNAKKVALLGVGSELRGDDAAGLLVARQLIRVCGRRKKGAEFKVFIGDTAPENLTGEIKKFKPTHVLIVDSAQMRQKAGAVKFIDPSKVGGISFCTHSLPVNILTDYLITSLGCEIIILGIQPKNIDFGGDVSPEVRESAGHVSAAIKEIIMNKESDV